MQWNKPKSVRQIGQAPGRNRIYMEDYVIRFARKLAGQNKGVEKAAVLLGAIHLINGEKIYQVSGIVEISGFAARTSPALSQDKWSQIFTEIKENFTDLEIVGWYFTCQGFSVKDSAKLLEIHKQNFQHRDKVLYMYDEAAQEDSFFLYRNGQFERQMGYYLYYEKNPEMLRYMEKEAQRHIHIVEQEDDRVIRNIRGIMEEKATSQRKRQRRESRMGYGLGTVVALITILVGAAALRNQSTLNQLQEQLQNLQELAMGEQKVQKNVTTVETLGNHLLKVTPASVEADSESAPPISGTAVQEQAAAPSPAQQPPVAK